MEEKEEIKPLTPEEVKAYKDKMVTYYNDQLPYLRVQAEYEKLLADIMEARVKKIIMDSKLAQLLAPPEEKKQTNKVEVPNG